MNDKKIIIIGTTASNLYIFRKEFIKECQRNGFQVYTFVSEYSDAWLEQLESLGVTVTKYRLSRGGMNPLKDIHSIFDLIKKIKVIKPDIVFTYSAKPIIYGIIAAKISKVQRVVGMLEGLGFTFTDQPNGLSTKARIIRLIQIILYKFTLPLLDHFIVLNPDDKTDVIDRYFIHVKKVSVLGGIGVNLVDYPYSKAPIKPIQFLFIGRLLKEKGIFEFIEAAKIVKQRYHKVKFIVLGEIDRENPGALTQSQLEDLLDQQLFEYPGFVTDVKKWIQNTSVFVLPSYREGLPRSTQEAMAIRSPIITTDVPGCRETVINNRNGFLVPKWNAEALAEKMMYFIENPLKINEMGSASREMAIANYDAYKINARLFNIVVN